MTTTTTTTGDDAKRTRSQAIDLLRAGSILWVVGLWHVFDYLPDVPGTKNAVTYRITVALLGLFVLVSGYLMGRKDIPLTAPALREFYIGRFGRIYPPFALACMVFAVLKMAPVVPLAKAALLVAMLWGPPPFTLWFIAMIVLFYAVTPLLAEWRARTRTYALAIVAITLVLVLAQAAGDAVSPRLAMYFPAYAVGLWLGRARPAWRTVAIAGLVVAVPGLALDALPPTPLIESSAWSLPWALGMPVLLFAAAMLADARLPRWAWVTLVAEASYFLYLFHRAIYAIALKLTGPVPPGARAAILLLLALPLALALALAGQRIYDRLWRRIGPRAA